MLAAEVVVEIFVDVDGGVLERVVQFIHEVGRWLISVAGVLEP